MDQGAALSGPCHDAAVLASVERDIESLHRATNLRDVITQVKDGSVARMRGLYGPQKGHAAHSLWPRMKVTINRREKLFTQLMDPREFSGDEERFFAFFTSACSKLQKSRRRKGDGNDSDTVPYQLIVEAISHCNQDIQEKKKKACYLDPTVGSFSIEAWQDKWGELNSWEVWRVLEKEYYQK
jgi:hypothetical protein